MSPALPLILIEGGKEDIPVKYSDERRKAVLAKLAPPQNITVKEVAEEEGISVATIYNWRREARQRRELLPDGASVQRQPNFDLSDR